MLGQLLLSASLLGQSGYLADPGSGWLADGEFKPRPSVAVACATPPPPSLATEMVAALKLTARSVADISARVEKLERIQAAQSAPIVIHEPDPAPPAPASPPPGLKPPRRWWWYPPYGLWGYGRNVGGKLEDVTESRPDASAVAAQAVRQPAYQAPASACGVDAYGRSTCVQPRRGLFGWGR